ncbi:MAG: MBL fold metallo-hydrolase [Thermodesulfobacteriota bacterium]
MKDERVRITILVDNQTFPDLTAEHGLSLWIETGGKHLLFDTGQGIALKSNARELGVNLAETDMLVLSHGHYDHTGGITDVLECAGHSEIFCHPGVMKPRYSIVNRKAKPIQMPWEQMAAIDKLPANRLHWVSQPVSISPTAALTGPIPRKTEFEDTGGPFFLDPDGRRGDPLDDDLALYIVTKTGLIVVVGCCHAGLVNTLHHIQSLTNGAAIRAVIGGFHLLNADNRRLAGTIAALQSVKPEKIVPCHCTGEKAVIKIQTALGERVAVGAAGMVFEF